MLGSLNPGEGGLIAIGFQHAEKEVTRNDTYSYATSLVNKHIKFDLPGKADRRSENLVCTR